MNEYPIYPKSSGRVCGGFVFKYAKCHYIESCAFTFLHSNGVTSGHQQDGTPPHFSRLVMEVLNAAFPGRWIGRSRSVLWPPRSPDLTPLYFFLLGYVNNYVYMDKIRVPNYLKARIREAVEQVTAGHMARSGISIGHMQGHEQCTYGSLLITFSTI
jgi:hypothetical protein